MQCVQAASHVHGSTVRAGRNWAHTESTGALCLGIGICASANRAVRCQLVKRLVPKLESVPSLCKAHLRLCARRFAMLVDFGCIRYRMHPDIAQVVSGLFYHSLLETPDSVVREREAAMCNQVRSYLIDVCDQYGL